MKIRIFTFNGFGENTYVLSDETKECVVIDPGCYIEQEEKQLKEYIKKEGLKPVRLLNTHCHIDHVLGNLFIKNTYNLPLEIHAQDQGLLDANNLVAPQYGFTQYQHASADKYFEEGQKITFGDSSLDILHLPGHAPGHVGFLSKEGGFIVSGDVLFQGSIGRTDLPGGDYDTLINSVKEKMFTLPDDTRVFPGHGPETTILFEKKNNPFFAGGR